MRTIVGYVPLESSLGVPLLSQNRQFQWFSKPTFVYPMVPASAATLLKRAGHEVLWLDGIAEELSQEEFDRRFLEFKPDLFLLETKTPVVRATWRKVDHLKALLPHCRIALCGDHVTALPEESLENSRADFILTGGDYDFSVSELAAHLEAPDSVPFPKGCFWRGADGKIESSGSFCNRDHDLATLPEIDRDLTRWELYSRKNGNFRRTPGAYTMAARDCWWGKCSFCSWTALYPEWRHRTPAQLLDEIEHLVSRYGVKEVFDDSGCFPAGAWLREFCEGMVSRGLAKKVTLGCNMIPGALDAELYGLMAKAGFKFVLFGLESANHPTLERINKCPLAKDVVKSMHLAHEAG
ncbi:MAG: radical SAM protein, partial [Kiritimatiellae bacterium]|nr:radical SAM protein [Kiritimatiellia bacterium]